VCSSDLKVTSIGMTGKTSKFAYKYNQDNLVLEQRSWDEDKLKSIELTKYFTNDFLSYLNKTGFELVNLNGISSTISKNEYYLKSLAQYPGGEEALIKYLQANVTGTSSIIDKGVVIIGFAIDLDGTITDIQIHRSVSKKSDKQAIQIIKGMPKWIPAKKSDGDLYKSTVSISIPFL
jgi:TonB family protein